MLCFKLRPGGDMGIYYVLMMWMVWWTSPESIKTPFAVRLLIGITLLEVLIQDMGLVKVLLVPSEEQRLGPTMGPRGA